MSTPSTIDTNPRSRARIWLGLALAAAGLLGHVLAARAIGGTQIAFRDHIFGFFLIAIVSGTIIALLGWKFWKGRRDITMLVFGVVQALFGLFIYIERFNIG